MKRYWVFSCITFIFLSLVGCVSHRGSITRFDVSQETWRQEVNTNPTSWARGADNWFMTGEPNATELMDRNAPPSAAISTMSVQVPAFNNLRVNGDFQVQLIGVEGPNSVNLYGPNDAVREVVVEVKGTTLCLTQVKSARHVRRVIVRIGVNQLHNLVQLGCGTIEGIQLHSAQLNIISMGPGNIYIGGPVNLQRVLNKGGGVVSVFGANSACLDILTLNGGAVNVSGNINLRSITHHGVANINVMGVHSPALTIKADGRGKVGIEGFDINLREVIAKGAVHVYVYNINSPSINVYAYGNARIGLAGYTANLYAETFKRGNFLGRSLCAQNAYVRAHDWSHMNVAASSKIFAASTESGSIYFFGSPNIMSQFVGGYGTVIPVWSAGGTSCAIEKVTPYAYNSDTTESIFEPTFTKSSSSSHITHNYVPQATHEVPFASTRNTKKPIPKPVGQG